MRRERQRNQRTSNRGPLSGGEEGDCGGLLFLERSWTADEGTAPKIKSQEAVHIAVMPILMLCPISPVRDRCARAIEGLFGKDQPHPTNDQPARPRCAFLVLAPSRAPLDLTISRRRVGGQGLSALTAPPGAEAQGVGSRTASL